MVEGCQAMPTSNQALFHPLCAETQKNISPHWMLLWSRAHPAHPVTGVCLDPDSSSSILGTVFASHDGVSLAKMTVFKQYPRVWIGKVGEVGRNMSVEVNYFRL